MRLVKVDSECPFSASSVWKLRESDDFYHFHGLKEKYQITVDKCERFQDADGNHKMRKVISCKLTNNPIPTAMRAIVDVTQITPIATLEWFLEHYDSDHACSYSVVTPAFEKSIKVKGKQWAVNSSNDACVVCTHFTVNCSMPVIGQIVEKMIVNIITKLYSFYEEGCVEYASENPSVLRSNKVSLAQPLAPAHLKITGFMRSSSTRSHKVSLMDPVEMDVQHAAPPCSGCALLCYYTASCVRARWYRMPPADVIVITPPRDPPMSTECAAILE